MVKRALLAALAGLASTPLTEVATVLLLALLPGPLDLVGNYFAGVVLPAVVLVVLVMAWPLARLLRGRPVWLGAVYGGVYLATHSALLRAIGNPLEDRLRYAGIIVGVVGISVYWLWRRGREETAA